MTPVDSTHAGESSVMPALDLGRFLTARLPRAHSISLMKLDVEGGEFKLLPWLLLHGAICHLRYLHLEWHLNRLAVEERLSGLALRLTLHALLEEGCEVPPASIFHDASTQNNVGFPIPGLLELATFHGVWGSSHRGPLATLKHDVAHIEARVAADSVLPNESQKSRCQTLASTAARISNATRPSCLGACPTERLLEDPQFTSASIKRVLAQPVSRESVLSSVPCFPTNVMGVNG